MVETECRLVLHNIWCLEVKLSQVLVVDKRTQTIRKYIVIGIFKRLILGLRGLEKVIHCTRFLAYARSPCQIQIELWRFEGCKFGFCVLYNLIGC